MFQDELILERMERCKGSALHMLKKGRNFKDVHKHQQRWWVDPSEKLSQEDCSSACEAAFDVYLNDLARKPVLDWMFENLGPFSIITTTYICRGVESPEYHKIDSIESLKQAMMEV